MARVETNGRSNNRMERTRRKHLSYQEVLCAPLMRSVRPPEGCALKARVALQAATQRRSNKLMQPTGISSDVIR